MIISDSTKKSLDWALQKAYQEEVTAWAFLVKDGEIQTVSNLGNEFEGDSLAMIVANTEAVLASIKDRIGESAQA